jgi:hypothetical protein
MIAGLEGGPSTDIQWHEAHRRYILDSLIYSALMEWGRLESQYHAEMETNELETARTRAALFTKETEILSMRTRTKDGALLQTRFCAILLQRHSDNVCCLVADAIRNAVDVLSWIDPALAESRQ